MNSLARHTLLALALLTPLAAPAAGQAADTVGSELQQTHSPDTLECDSYPCTLAQQSFEYWGRDYVSSGVITKWSARLAAGASATLRLFRENAGDTYTPVGASAAGSATSAGVKTFNTRIRVGYGSHLIGIDLNAGGVATDVYPVDDGVRAMFWQPRLATGATSGPDGFLSQELMVNAVVEPDVDEDGYGDESQDSCVFCNTSGGNTGDGGSVPAQPPSGSSYSARTGQKQKGPVLAVESRAILRPPNAGGRKGYIDVFYSNPGDEDVKGKLTLKLGRKSLGTRSVELDWADEEYLSNFRLKRPALTKLRRKGKLKLTAIASYTAAGGKARKVTKTLTVIKGGAKGFDGTYRGAGPLVIKVEQGVIRAMNIQLNTFCLRSKRTEPRVFSTVPGFPSLVKGDGSFSAKGSLGYDTMTYRGKLSRRGVSKGYLSLFHNELTVGSEGKLLSDTCFDARNWKAKRS